MSGPIRVVVVDDQPLARAGHALILDSADGIDVVGEAGNGLEALDAAAVLHPDVVLMDVRMPLMGGLEATRLIAERHPAVRVIVLTTFDLDEYAFGSLRAGASAFLLKSSKPAALVEAVQAVAAGESVVSPRLTAQLVAHFVGSEESEGPLGGRAEEPGELAILSPRERDVFLGIVRGETNAEIAASLHLAPSTVKSHVNAIFAKLHLRDRVHAVILGYEIGVAEAPQA
ncbi:response regulator [Leucobacter aridicollis]|uniref:DNA-binding NarL/FixJ family response regulator n=1 Tax=Leucobacter aridicollis TaxID=283878 RepID=A0A852R228_9MICO|nr:response regulator transcription factor [Leucobacter aridicollis]MBL3681313.1 DNA-binding response regulator [Leucobacter aridicollis]NYD27661.1 DNA-binding NarL/FixJ family response regulator [Leucobacter aridicollis]